MVEVQHARCNGRGRRQVKIGHGQSSLWRDRVDLSPAAREISCLIEHRCPHARRPGVRLRQQGGFALAPTLPGRRHRAGQSDKNRSLPFITRAVCPVILIITPDLKKLRDLLRR
ncbi:hypothetical protein FRUB_07762 [Fimbriiglobus ruber]|uniref:Uncharacterized protein n=1 Tax=Fimbriiglobus ruber TaxID=1908690 RepID=A0A225DB03_9BACT|nr:hypothetical protein FRUB_07762 [Fimbriiglobus ruber]